jgi:small subunit ribosomal protein S19e
MQKTLYDIEASAYVKALAEKLKEIEEFGMPEWAKFVKTSTARARPPATEWWHLRAASILRQLYINGVLGVSRLRTRYGGKKDRGMAPKRFYRGSGKIIRVILQQAEKSGFVEKIKDKKSGRKLTKKGKDFLDETAKSL